MVNSLNIFDKYILDDNFSNLKCYENEIDLKENTEAK